MYYYLYLAMMYNHSLIAAQKYRRAHLFIFIGKSIIKILRWLISTGAGGDEKHLIKF
jgi:hypothetical protein